MEAIKAKGEVFTVLPDGTVVRRFSSFAEMFADYEYVKDDWQIDFEEEMKAEIKRHRLNKLKRKANLEAQRGTVAVIFAFVSALMLFSVIG